VRGEGVRQGGARGGGSARVGFSRGGYTGGVEGDSAGGVQRTQPQWGCIEGYLAHQKAPRPRALQ
jgi:hypothetical protein